VQDAVASNETSQAKALASKEQEEELTKRALVKKVIIEKLALKAREEKDLQSQASRSSLGTGHEQG